MIGGCFFASGEGYDKKCCALRMCSRRLCSSLVGRNDGRLKARCGERATRVGGHTGFLLHETGLTMKRIAARGPEKRREGALRRLHATRAYQCEPSAVKSCSVEENSSKSKRRNLSPLPGRTWIRRGRGINKHFKIV